MQKIEVTKRIADTGAMAIVRVKTVERGFEIAQGCLDGGIDCLEISYTLPNAGEVIAALREKYGDKLVVGAEFDVAYRSIASSQLADEDELIFIGSASEMEQIVLQSHGGCFLRFQTQEVSTMKKTALGVRGMKLADDDYLEHAYLLAGHQEYTISYHDKEYALNKVRLAKRDTKGIKPRI